MMKVIIFRGKGIIQERRFTVIGGGQRGPAGKRNVPVHRASAEFQCSVPAQWAGVAGKTSGQAQRPSAVGRRSGEDQRASAVDTLIGQATSVKKFRDEAS